jgi:uncharacterized protein (UPF0147 family)
MPALTGIDPKELEEAAKRRHQGKVKVIRRIEATSVKVCLPGIHDEALPKAVRRVDVDVIEPRHEAKQQKACRHAYRWNINPNVSFDIA